MTTQRLLTLFLLSSLIGLSACRKDEPDDPVIPNEEEVITTLIYSLVPDDGSSPVELTFEDLDGDGGEDPTITSGVLSANTTYTGSLQLLNEQETPAEDITEEIEEEDEDHQFFFSTDVAGLSVAYNDADANGDPVGLETIVTTGDAGMGSLIVILRHEPQKDAMGVSDGDITNAGGETDIEVTFEIEVQSGIRLTNRTFRDCWVQCRAMRSGSRATRQ